MVIHIDQIRDAGLRVDESLSLTQLDAALQAEGRDTGFRAAAPGQLKGLLRKVSGGVLVDASVQATLKAPCRRCLVPVEVPVSASFRLNLVPASKVQAREGREQEQGRESEEGEHGGSFSLEEADQEVFDGKNIDLDPIVREQLLLAVPMNAVCREDCKGLCGQCGQNLNDAQCGCDARPVDPRLASLKNIKLN